MSPFRLPHGSAALLFLVGAVHAQEVAGPSPSKLEELSLEERLEIPIETVYGASKQSQSAPSRLAPMSAAMDLRRRHDRERARGEALRWAARAVLAADSVKRQKLRVSSDLLELARIVADRR